MAPSKNDRDARLARERLRSYQARQAVHEKGTKRRRRDNLIAGIAIVLVAAAAVGLQLAYFSAGPGKPAAKATPTATATPTPTPTPTATANQGDVPSKSIAAGRNWTGTLTLNKDIPLGITLDGKAAPQASSSMISLIEKGWYTGTVCHRLTTSSTFKVLQCGGAKTVAAGPTGGPGYSFGPIENAPAITAGSKTTDNPYGSAVYKTGVIAMARESNNAYSNGSQFFIVYGATTIPNDEVGGYTVVGTVTSGLDKVVTDIASKGSDNSNGTDDGVPKVATTITGFSIK